jgi:ferredoxin--NADP+ reductase
MTTPEELAFKAGQYVAFGVDQSEKVLERAFSIVSSPYEPELEFFIEKVPEGALSPKLYELHVGDQVFMRKKAKGIFNVDVKSGHSQHFLVSTVTGIAPYISMVRTLALDLKEGRLAQPFRLVILQGVSKSTRSSTVRRASTPGSPTFRPSAGTGRIPNGPGSGGGWTTWCANTPTRWS